MSSSIPQTSGIYKITCVPTGKVYIGSAVNLRQRIADHLKRLRHNRHGNSHLQRAWNKYGEVAFEFSIIELVLTPFLLEREQYWLDRTRAYDKEKGFNLSPTAGSSLGIKRSDEFRQKVSRAGKGRKQSAEWIERNAAARRGRKLSPEMREKLSVAQRKSRAEQKHNPSARRGNSWMEQQAKTYVVTTPEGEEFVIRNLTAFCRERGLTATGMYYVVYGKQKHHKGWKCRLFEP